MSVEVMGSDPKMQSALSDFHNYTANLQSSQPSQFIQNADYIGQKAVEAVDAIGDKLMRVVDAAGSKLTEVAQRGLEAGGKVMEKASSAADRVSGGTLPNVDKTAEPAVARSKQIAIEAPSAGIPDHVQAAAVSSGMKFESHNVDMASMQGLPGPSAAPRAPVQTQSVGIGM